MRSEDARALRRALRTKVDRSALLSDPETILGPFDALPLYSQRAIGEAIAQDDRWRMAAEKSGVWRAPLTRKLWGALQKLPRPLGRLPREAIQILAVALQSGPRWALYATSRRAFSLKAKFSRRPTLPNVLAAARVDVRNLAVHYARRVPQLPPYRGFWHEQARHTTVGLLVGVDFIKNSEGHWFVESNMDCGLDPMRTAMYEEDPLVRGVLDFTAANGYRRLIVLSGQTSVEPAMARQYKKGSADRKLAVTLLEDAYQPLFGHETGIRVPDLEGETLLVRNRHFRTSLDYVIHHKRASSRALRIYKQETGDSSFQLPTTSSEPCVGPAGPADPFPNLVFKFPAIDAGEGVVFLKVASAAQASEVLGETLRAIPSRSVASRIFRRLHDQQGLFQPYVRTPWDSDRRLRKTRAYVLLTPIGVHFIAANRLICATPVPRELPMGIVRDQRPYLVSWRPGAKLEVMPPEEMPSVREAALGVARGLSRALFFGFETGSGSSEPAEEVADVSDLSG